MVQVHAGDNGAIVVKNIDCVQPPAQADFQNHHVCFAPAENINGGKGVEFKIGERNAAARGFYAFKRGNDFAVGHGFAIDGNALVEAQQVRAGERADRVARFGEDARQKGADRTFAVGAAHGDNGAGRIKPHGIAHTRDARQAHVYQTAAVGGFQMREPL